MEAGLRALVEAFAGLQVAVVGDAVLDRWLSGTSTRLCREAPVPVVDLGRTADRAGGAANVAVNLAALGADVELVAAVGADAEADALRCSLTEAGVEAAGLVVDGDRRTSTKARVAADGQMLVRVDSGDRGPLAEATSAALAGRLRALLPRLDALVVSDYGEGVRSPAVVAAVAAWRAAGLAVCTVDARDPAAWSAVRPRAVKPNADEVAQLLGLPSARGSDRPDAVSANAARILEVTGSDVAAVTLDRDGAVVLERGEPPYRTWAEPREVAGATGCGDTYVAALTLALAAGAGTVAAAEIASAAAAVVLAKPATAVCTLDELAEGPSHGKRLGGAVELEAAVRAHRRAGRSVVFTNGCFDLLHRGHVTSLSRAKELGDVLVVAVNDDAGVARLKGAARPANGLEDRLEVLAALSCVDHVVAFGGDTPDDLLRAARPDVYAKGADHTLSTLPEAALVAALGGRVALLDYLPDRSTSEILGRARRGAPSKSSEDGLRVERDGIEVGP